MTKNVQKKFISGMKLVLKRHNLNLDTLNVCASVCVCGGRWVGKAGGWGGQGCVCVCVPVNVHLQCISISAVYVGCGISAHPLGVRSQTVRLVLVGIWSWGPHKNTEVVVCSRRSFTLLTPRRDRDMISHLLLLSRCAVFHLVFVPVRPFTSQPPDQNINYVCRD